MKISLLTGGEKHYQLGLLSGLIGREIKIDLIGNNEIEIYGKDLLNQPNITFYNLRGETNINASVIRKIHRILRYYIKLIIYTIKTDSGLFHIQWENKFLFFDRTILLLFYKTLKKKIIITAHNIDINKRNDKKLLLGWISLWIMYHLSNHIIVHTDLMKNELIKDFGLSQQKITVISHGINNRIPIINMSSRQAKEKLELSENNKILLFFGAIEKYKGIDILLYSLKMLIEKDSSYMLLISGSPWNNTKYLTEINQLIKSLKLEKHIIKRYNFIPDDEIEKYFMAADCLILPYRQIYQSGVVFISFFFGLPIIASEVGSFKEVIDNKINGLTYYPNEPKYLFDKVSSYFCSNMYLEINNNRKIIKDSMQKKYSWKEIGMKTIEVYKNTKNQ